VKINNLLSSSNAFVEKPNHVWFSEASTRV